MSTNTKLFRLQVLCKKKEGVSDEEFHKYWLESHPKVLWSVPIVKEKIVQYSQFHVDKAASDLIKSAGLYVPDFDGVGSLYATSVEDLLAVNQDPEFIRLVVPDESKFVDRADWQILIGHDEHIWIDGKVVTGRYI